LFLGVLQIKKQNYLSIYHLFFQLKKQMQLWCPRWNMNLTVLFVWTYGN